MKQTLTAFLLIIIVLGCKTSGEKALRKGKYSKALNQAIATLRSKPNNQNALDVVKSAYPEVINELKETLKDSSRKKAKEKFVYEVYKDLIDWNKKITACKPCMEELVNIEDFSINYKIAAENYAAILYNKALDRIEIANKRNDIEKRQALRLAYDDLAQVERVLPNFQNTNKLMADCKANGTAYVLLQPNSYYPNFQNYWTTPNEFENQLVGLLNRHADNTRSWIVFKPNGFNSGPGGANQNQQVDYVLRYDWQTQTWGPTTSTSRTENFSKNIKVGSGANQTTQTVTATATIYRQEFIFQGVVNMELIHARTYRTVRNTVMPLTYAYYDERASYTGDRRALSNSVERLVNKSNFNYPSSFDIQNNLYRDMERQIDNNINGFLYGIN